MYQEQTQDDDHSFGIALRAPLLDQVDEQPTHQPAHHVDDEPLASSSLADLPQPITRSRDYQEALRMMEKREWQRVVPLLRALQAQNPAANELENLLQEAAFRADVESQWAEQVTGRQEVRWPMRLLAPVIALFVLGLLSIIGLRYYGYNQQVNALIHEQTALLQQAQSALAASEPRTALDLFEQLLAANPTDAAARQGKVEALRQMRFASDYQIALDHIGVGNYQQALTLLMNIQSAIPNYRDVDKRLQELQTMLGAPRFFADAEAAFADGLWMTAIINYEQARRLDPDHEPAVTQEHLATAYFKIAQQMIANRPNDSTIPEGALRYFQKALELKATDSLLKTEVGLLQAYIEGERLANQGSYEPAIQKLLPLYEMRPTYFGGYVSELLYRAYVGIAERYVAAQALTEALAAYQRAVTLGLDPGGLLQQRITALALLLTPAPTEIPTELPPPLSIPVVMNATPMPPAAVTPVDDLARYAGWIAFRSQRNGQEEIFVMRSDGSEVQPAPAAVTTNFTELYQQQQMNGTGGQRLYVKQKADQSGDNIFVTGALAPISDSDRMLTTYQGTEYDPVWSPDGQWIAFVANHTGNDEIWLMDGAGAQLRQLTFNEWQWDKHPSFSPDGQQLVFYSNRTGFRQIWRMAATGSDQQNLSNNAFEDWDPVWLR